MFIHIGNGNVIRANQIVTIMDAAIMAASTIMDDMLIGNASQIVGNKEESKSAVITSDKIYYSTLSVPTLKKRASITATISNLEDYSDEL